MSNRILVANQDTWLKASLEMALELSDNEKMTRGRNSVITAKSVTEVPETSHSKIELADAPGRFWFIYSAHWSPVEITPSGRKSGGRIAGGSFSTTTQQFPQSSVTINWSDFRDNISEYFTVGELLNYDKRRVPSSDAAKKRLVLLATEMDKIRKEWGSAIRVTSGYRPEPINRQVGGVANSRHTFGDAIDIAPVNGNIVAFQRWLDQNWFGALGYGAQRGFVHLDMRNSRGWKSGGLKGPRWRY